MGIGLSFYKSSINIHPEFFAAAKPTLLSALLQYVESQLHFAALHFGKARNPAWMRYGAPPAEGQ
jgi:hypothetical protein